MITWLKGPLTTKSGSGLAIQKGIIGNGLRRYGRDLELTKAEQTPEAYAFLNKRTDEKPHHLEVMAVKIAESQTAQLRDRLEAMHYLMISIKMN